MPVITTIPVITKVSRTIVAGFLVLVSVLCLAHVLRVHYEGRYLQAVSAPYSDDFLFRVTWLDRVFPQRIRQSAEALLVQEPAVAAAQMLVAVKSDVLNPYLWSRLSVAYLSAKDFERAEWASRRALDLAPQTFSVLTEQAYVGVMLPAPSAAYEVVLRMNLRELVKHDVMRLWHYMKSAQALRPLCEYVLSDELLSISGCDAGASP